MPLVVSYVKVTLRLRDLHVVMLLFYCKLFIGWFCTKPMLVLF